MCLQGALDEIGREVSSWNGVVVSPHRFGGTEFRLGRRELGHVHGDSFADIVLPMDVRNNVIDEGMAEPHHILPKSGWITFRFRKQGDIERAIELFRLSYDYASKR